MTDLEIKYRIMALTKALEEHEFYENFKCDGVPFIDPHTGGMSSPYDFSSRAAAIRAEEIRIFNRLNNKRVKLSP